MEIQHLMDYDEYLELIQDDCVSTNATVTPDLPIILSLSLKLNAIPIKLATGAKVIYLLFSFTLIIILPSFLTIPVSILPVASEPLFGPVKPKQGIILHLPIQVNIYFLFLCPIINK